MADSAQIVQWAEGHGSPECRAALGRVLSSFAVGLSPDPQDWAITQELYYSARMALEAPDDVQALCDHPDPALRALGEWIRANASPEEIAAHNRCEYALGALHCQPTPGDVERDVALRRRVPPELMHRAAMASALWFRGPGAHD